MTITSILASLASLLAIAIFTTLLITYLRRRRALSLDRIEQDLQLLEQSLHDWQRQTHQRDADLRKSWHGEWAALAEFDPKERIVKHHGKIRVPDQARWKRRSDPILPGRDATLPFPSSIVSRTSTNAIRFSRSALIEAKRALLPQTQLPLRPKRVEVVRDKHGGDGARLSILALRSPLDRSSFLADDRIKPFTRPETPQSESCVFQQAPTLVIQEEHPPLSNTQQPPPSSANAVDLPLPSVLLRAQRLHASQDPSLDSRASHESIRVEEFDLEFPVPSPEWTPESPFSTALNQEIEENVMDKVIEEQGQVEEEEGEEERESTPMSMVTDKTDGMDAEDSWEIEADTLLSHPTNIMECHTKSALSSLQDVQPVAVGDAMSF